MRVETVDDALDIVKYYHTPTNSYLSFKLVSIKDKLEKNGTVLRNCETTTFVKESRILPLTNMLKSILPKVSIEYECQEEVFIQCPKNAIVTQISAIKPFTVCVNDICLIKNKSAFQFKSWFPFFMISKYELCVSTETESSIVVTYRFLPKYWIEKLKKQRLIATIEHNDIHFYNNDIFSL